MRRGVKKNAAAYCQNPPGKPFMPSFTISPPPPLAALVAVTLLAPCAGAGYFPWGQAVLLCAVGLFFLLAPPRRLPGKWLACGSVLLLVAALVAFLPATLFPQPAWRKLLTGELGVPLPGTHTPQPWMTFEATALLAAALGWGWLLFSAEWSASQPPVRSLLGQPGLPPLYAVNS